MHKKTQTYLWVGHFTTLSGHFLANHINIFHKIELQMVILMYPTCLNLIGIKSWYIKHNFLFFCNFVKKFLKINGHFRTISGHFLANHIKIFHQTEVQTVILSCLVYLNHLGIRIGISKFFLILFFSQRVIKILYSGVWLKMIFITR